MPLKYKLILAPAVIIIPVIFVIFMMLYYLNVIGQQNDTVRNWANTTDQIHIAITSTEQLTLIAEKLSHAQTIENEELIFNYIEQSRVLEESIKNPVLRDKILPTTLNELFIINNELKFNEKMVPLEIKSALEVLSPKLEYLYNSLQAQKRAIYIESNEYIKNKTSSLASISVSVLALCVLLGVTLSLWITRTTTAKIKHLAQNANLVCDLNNENKDKSFDDLEDLALCLSIISSRMLNNIAAEKLLQSVEDERRRIAMDIHDQFLSDLNIFKRNLNEKFKNKNSVLLTNSDINDFNATLDELAFSLRGIIDDLHPQTLNMFGLDAALKSYLERKLSADNLPDYYISIDANAEKRLNFFQKLCLYRIALESIQNIIRHAHCSRYEIDLRITNDYLTFSIEDNGIGMSHDEHTQKRGHGIFNITQRAFTINSEIQWNTSRFSTGTQVLIKLPVAYLNNPANSAALKASNYVQAI